MPTYEYECKKTGEIYEVTQKITDPPLEKCPDCGGPVQKLISGGTGFIMKGAPCINKGAAPQCGQAQRCCGASEHCGNDSCHES